MDYESATVPTGESTHAFNVMLESLKHDAILDYFGSENFHAPTALPSVEIAENLENMENLKSSPALPPDWPEQTDQNFQASAMRLPAADQFFRCGELNRDLFDDAVDESTLKLAQIEEEATPAPRRPRVKKKKHQQKQQKEQQQLEAKRRMEEGKEEPIVSSAPSEENSQFAAAAAYTARLVASNAQLNAQLQLLDTQAAQSRKLAADGAASGSTFDPGENFENLESSG